MTSEKKPIPMKEIERHQLPAYERNGCQAQEIPGKEILVITLHQTRIDIETVSGVAVEAPERLRTVRPGISDTVLLGSLSKTGKVALLDVLMVSQSSSKGKAWKDRQDILWGLRERLSEDFKASFQVARTHRVGLMKIFDKVVGEGGLGLLLRIEGSSQAILCRWR